MSASFIGNQVNSILAWVAVLTLDHVATSGVGPMVRVLTNEFTWLPIKLALIRILACITTQLTSSAKVWRERERESIGMISMMLGYARSVIRIHRHMWQQNTTPCLNSFQ